jgi:putative endonuclease
MRYRYWFVYIMTNKAFGTLYIGVTGNLATRAAERKAGEGSAFTTRYRLDRLVYFEGFDNPRGAIQREKTMKHWPRQWKLNAIIAKNPDWRDLFETLGPD